MQTQLNGLSNYVEQSKKPVESNNLLDVSSLVRTQVKEELARHKAEEVKQKEIATKESNTGLSTILPIVGSALTESQQLWLSKPDVLMKLPNFLADNSGKEALQILVEEFKTFLGN